MKSTYITDLTFEILINKDLLAQWASKSKDMEFLGLSIEILSDIDLLDKWDCDNIINLKLAGLLSQGKDFTLKNGMLIKVDQSYQLPTNANEYKRCINSMLAKKVITDIVKEDLINQGYTVKQIKNAENRIKAQAMLQSHQFLDKYSVELQKNLFLNMIPNLIDRSEIDAKEFYKQKTDEFLKFIIDNTNETKNNSIISLKETELNNKINPFPLLFVSGEVYDCFIKYVKYIIDYYIDYSYLKKRLESMKLIHHHTDNEFMKDIFYEMKLINEKSYNDYMIRGKLDSLSRSSNTHRENVFNIIFEEFLPQ